MSARLWLSILSLGGCVATPQIAEQPPTRLRCEATLLKDETTWCVALNGSGDYLIVERLGGVEQQRMVLPIPSTITLRQVLSLGYGFDSLWLGYSGHPMTVLRLDPATLVVRATIPVETGWFSRWAGSVGLLAVGSSDVWVLSNSELHRIGPADDAVTGRVALPGRAQDVVEGHGAVWIAMMDSLIEVSTETLDIRRTFALPEGTAVLDPLFLWELGQRRHILADVVSVEVALSVRRRLLGPGPPILCGRPDSASGVVVLVECSP